MLFLEIRRNRKLAARRSPMFEKNRFAKVFMYCGIAFWAAYLLFIGVMLPFAFQESFPGMEPYHILNQGLVIILAIDFLIRFMLPSSIQEIKPYLLLPVPKRKVIFTFLLDKLWHPFNFFWLFLFIPFALITITRFYGITGVIGYAVGIWLLMVMNGYWSTLICTLKREKFIYFLGSILFYGILTLLEFLPETGWISTLTMNWGEGFILWNPLSFGGAIVLICLLLFINYIVQLHFLYKELSHTEDTKIKHISSYKFLDRYGNVGEYMRLELKMFFRNKAPRSQFWGFIFIMCMFATALASDVYGDSYMNNFICLYCYCILGLMTLNRIMTFEGNYIDGLMVRKESLYNMLRAKYYLQCIFLVIPFLFSLIPVCMGTIPLLMSIAYLCFTMGTIFAMMMQMAVYNNKTAPLNTNTIGKQQGNNMYQSLIVICAFSLPLLINKALTLFLDETTAYIILTILGLSGFVTHRYWIHNIYVRLMKRKYQNMEGFRNTR